MTGIRKSKLKWLTIPLGDVADIRSGSINPARFPKEQFHLFSIPAYDAGRIPEAVDGVDIKSNKTIVEPNDCLFSKLNPRICRVWLVGNRKDNRQIASTEFWPIYSKMNGSVPWLLPEYLEHLLRLQSFRAAFVGRVEASTRSRERLKPEQILHQKIPVPPLPVQDRILQTLQKTDEIRRKREEALRLADAILPASFIAMFGDPNENHHEFRWLPLGQIADIRSGVTKGRKLGAKETIEVPYLRVANVQDGFLNLSEVKTIQVLPGDVEKYHLEDGDILMTEGGDPDKLGRGAIWRGQVEGCIHQNHVFRVRVNREKLAPEYLAALMRTQYAKQYFLSCAKRSSNLASINSTQVKAFAVPLPPIKMQEKFVSAVEQWVQASQNLTEGLKDASGLFASMMKQAFAGQLTAEWEAANAERIAEQLSLDERLPQLLLLGLIRERIARVERSAQPAILMTALMKYAFLFQMEGDGQRRLYHFIPYQYGPFAKQVYEDLSGLVQNGVVRMENDQDQEKTRITLVDTDKADEMLANIPEDVKVDLASIVETYGSLNHRDLLKVVSKKYPAYAKKSRITKRAGTS
jgi:type I restriction enzyme, S subunit